MAFFPTWAVAEIASGLIGAGFGAYLAVDLALITQVLPSRENCGKDLGIMNVTNALPPAVAPLIGAACVNGFGQNSATGYRLLFVLAGCLAVASALVVRRITSVD
jgi:MFS family permease